MIQRPPSGAARPTPRAALTLPLCFIVGFNLRAVLLGVPPVLPLIQHDLRLSYTVTGLVVALPTLCMGALAWPSASIAARAGGRRAVALGLALVAAGAALRGVGAGAVPLLAFTGLLSAGIALAQTTMPVLVRQWLPARIGLGAAVYVNGLVVGEAVAAAATGPLLLRLLGADAWAATFVAWACLVALTLALWLWLAPASPPLGFAAPRPAPRPPAGGPGVATPARRVTFWHLGALLGSASLAYFSMNTWIPGYDLAVGRASATTGALAALNGAQLPVSLAVAVAAQRVTGRRWPFMLAGVLVLLGLGMWLWGPAGVAPLAAAVVGAGSACGFTLGTALPPLLAGRDEVARLTGGTLGLSYTLAFVGPLVGGGLLDLAHVPALAFLPIGVAAALLTVLGALLPARGAPDPDAPASGVHHADATSARP